MRPRSESCRGGAPSALSSVLGSCWVLLALVDRSTAFIASGGGAGAASFGVLSGRRGAISALGSRVVPDGLVPGEAAGGPVRRRRTQLGMAIDTTNNPITSKVYGRADAKGGSKTPDMNEEIAASGVGWIEVSFRFRVLGRRGNLHEAAVLCVVYAANCNFVVRPSLSTPTCTCC